MNMAFSDIFAPEIRALLHDYPASSCPPPWACMSRVHSPVPSAHKAISIMEVFQVTRRTATPPVVLDSRRRKRRQLGYRCIGLFLCRRTLLKGFQLISLEPEERHLSPDLFGKKVGRLPLLVVKLQQALCLRVPLRHLIPVRISEEVSTRQATIEHDPHVVRGAFGENVDNRFSGRHVLNLLSNFHRSHPKCSLGGAGSFIAARSPDGNSRTLSVMSLHIRAVLVDKWPSTASGAHLKISKAR
mmetsp:Transcript_417/g.918  ORF Transcript_417/g.918 Transcript_417/m.918 type:complete len:243 (-) Transcript_417:861-1589(-)